MASDPVLIAYGAKSGQGRKRTYWQRIGAAYPHETGAGLTVVLDVIPLDGRIILRELGPDDDERLLGEAKREAACTNSGGRTTCTSPPHRLKPARARS